MNKLRRLSKGDEALIIFEVDIGFTQYTATFKEYRTIDFHGINHEIPIFDRKTSELSGLDCFWVLLSDMVDDLDIERFQRELVGLQLEVLEIGILNKYKIPEKIKDREIKKMATTNAAHRTALIDEFGYDPLDYSWVERELPSNDREKNWFTFQRERKGSFDDNWEQTIEDFNSRFKDDVTVEEAVSLCRRWKRYVTGAWNTIIAKNPKIEDWKKAAKKFEEHHYSIEKRMNAWSKEHQGDYPLVKVLEPIRFQYGPYFNECMERIPKMFTDSHCSHIKEDVILRLVMFDTEHKFNRFDFTPDICRLIKGNEQNYEPWKTYRVDYIISTPPDEYEDKVELL